jgi:hypothetical protein
MPLKNRRNRNTNRVSLTQHIGQPTQQMFQLQIQQPTQQMFRLQIQQPINTSYIQQPIPTYIQLPTYNIDSSYENYLISRFDKAEHENKILKDQLECEKWSTEECPICMDNKAGVVFQCCNKKLCYLCSSEIFKKDECAYCRSKLHDKKIKCEIENLQDLIQNDLNK